MTTKPRISEDREGLGLAVELLSVDADAHLEKLAAHMFPSPALLPVELVRGALKRKASFVSIHVRPERIVISDDGVAIDKEEWQALACLGDSGQGAAARERALAHIQDRAQPGIGMLAVFLPGIRGLQIETADAAGTRTLRMADGRVVLQNAGSRPKGSRITIQRRRGPAAEEKVLLAQLCAPAPAEISINGRRLKRMPLLARNLASLTVRLAENSTPSLLAIPVQGDACRIWLLDQGIPWQVTTMAAFQGLVFAAVIETTKQLTEPALDTLAANAGRLYRWLAENYDKFPERHQTRIEDLFFRQARHAGDPGMLSVCAPFRVWPSRRRISLADVRRMAAHGPVFAADLDSRPGPFIGRDKEMLLLTRPQKDFLIHHLRLPVVSLNAPPRTKVRPAKIVAFFRAKWRTMSRLADPARSEIIDGSRMSLEESDFCRELEICLRRESTRIAPDRGTTPASVVMVAGRGLSPAFWLKNGTGRVLGIRRRHPIARRCLRAVNFDRDNCELAFTALLPGPFLTGGGH
jgi:hypothetical protein